MSRLTRGFTLPETLIAISLITFITAFSLPLTVSFFGLQSKNEVATGLASVLRKAETQARSLKGDSSFGVKVLPNTYVLFAGDTYDTRVQSEDETFPIAGSVEVTGPEEIVFAKYTGVPSAIGTYSVAFGASEYDITVYENGMVEQ